MTNTLTIRTPEGVEFRLILAGPMVRLVACTLDFFVKMVIFDLVQLGVAVTAAMSEDFAIAFALMAYFMISTLYQILFEWFWQGQTIGKRLLRLRVMDSSGLKIQFSQIVIRNLLRAVDFIPAGYMVGGITAFVNKKSQRLGDLAANTIVVRTLPAPEPDLSQLLKDKYNSLRDYPHLTARLRQNVSPQEADTAMQAILRRDDFDDVERVELFSEVARYFKSIVKFPPEALDGIPDEQYIRNVVDVLFRGSAQSNFSNTT